MGIHAAFGEYGVQVFGSDEAHRLIDLDIIRLPSCHTLQLHVTDQLFPVELLPLITSSNKLFVHTFTSRT